MLLESLGWVVKVLVSWVIQNFVDDGWGREILEGAWCDARVLVGFARVGDSAVVYAFVHKESQEVSYPVVVRGRDEVKGLSGFKGLLQNCHNIPFVQAPFFVGIVIVVCCFSDSGFWVVSCGSDMAVVAVDGLSLLRFVPEPF